MKRLQISLEPDLDAALGREADREGVSKAEIVRRCLRERVEPLPPIEEDPLFAMFGTGTGGGLRPGETIDDVLYGPVKHNE
jgi:Ribbon-helix-helix protein, copG family